MLIPLATCAPGYTKLPDGSCCNNRFLGVDGKTCNIGAQPCAPGEFRDERGVCIPIPSANCPPGQFRDTPGLCTPLPSTACPPGEERNREGACVRIPFGFCRRDKRRSRRPLRADPDRVSTRRGAGPQWRLRARRAVRSATRRPAPAAASATGSDPSQKTRPRCPVERADISRSGWRRTILASIECRKDSAYEKNNGI